MTVEDLIAQQAVRNGVTDDPEKLKQDLESRERSEAVDPVFEQLHRRGSVKMPGFSITSF